jgi:hypothetical protein
VKKEKAMKFVNESPLVLIDEGVYPVTILSVEESLNQYYKEGEPEYRKTRLTWTFEMPDGKTTIRFYTGKNLGSQKANLAKLCAAVAGKAVSELTDKEKNDFSDQDMIGKKVMIKIIHTEDDDGNTWHRIQSVKPIETKKGKPMPF